MTEPQVLFTMRLNKARHDKPFQFLLAQCFGTRVRGIDTGSGAVCEGFEWRGVMYVTSMHDPND